MEASQLSFQEHHNVGTSWTKNKNFDQNGYLVLRNFCNPQELYHVVPQERGQLNYWSKNSDQFIHDPIEKQVAGSVARYWHPQYRDLHNQIRLKLEKELGRSLYNTYYYDRFYFPGQKLEKHLDRDACEISVTVHVSTNLNNKQKNWPIWIKTPDTFSDEKKKTLLKTGEDHKVFLQPGDAMIYKGCERPHWREPMPGLKTLFKNTTELYYHQIFFHYVLQDGQRAHCAFDAAR